ncbi:MAG: bifunctional 4-hydroxy-2-oxoglutarate aldolase/2-dehydro-3-deoxy-phosphogluconate aldolase [Clostridia bacterium]|nr:bifunctional 4-hydroxy-2-oxoglutarate aldolase/2-dehydro-3-deoxy-phosphogluconate aldolase [Clostridia bacterium]
MNSDSFKKAGVIPVVVINNADDAVPTAKALLAGGINVMEITLRTPAAIDAIGRVSRECPDMITGAGTVLNAEQCRAAIAAGAEFIVSPGLSAGVVEEAKKSDVPVIPGCVTPTEIMAALDMGIKTVKFFPAQVYGGLSAMKALAAPFGGVKFIPTGGVNADNLSEYLAAPFIEAVGGSWLCTAKDISSGNFGKITALCLEASAKVKESGR